MRTNFAGAGIAPASPRYERGKELLLYPAGQDYTGATVLRQGQIFWENFFGEFFGKIFWGLSLFRGPIAFPLAG